MHANGSRALNDNRRILIPSLLVHRVACLLSGASSPIRVRALHRRLRQNSSPHPDVDLHRDAFIHHTVHSKQCSQLWWPLWIHSIFQALVVLHRQRKNHLKWVRILGVLLSGQCLRSRGRQSSTTQRHHFPHNTHQSPAVIVTSRPSNSHRTHSAHPHQ